MENKENSSRLEALVFHLSLEGKTEKYGFNIFKVQEIINLPHVTTIPLAPKAIVGMINVRGDIMALVDLKQAIHGQTTDLTKNPMVIICQTANTKIGLLVEHVENIVESTWDCVHSIDSILPDNNFLVGVLKIEEDLISILNLEYLVMTYSQKKEATKENNVVLSKKNLENCLVLVIDDSGLAQKMITHGLDQVKIKHMVANDGGEALEKIKSHQPNTFNLILCDIEMPKMDGYSFLAEFKKDTVFGSVPVVMYSSLSDAVSIEKARKLGAADYITKYNVETLLKAVEQHAKI